MRERNLYQEVTKMQHEFSCDKPRYTLAEHCNYGVVKDEFIRDCLVVSLLDSRLQERMQLDSDLTLENVVEKAQKTETVKLHQCNLKGENPTEACPVDSYTQ